MAVAASARVFSKTKREPAAIFAHNTQDEPIDLQKINKMSARLTRPDDKKSRFSTQKMGPKRKNAPIIMNKDQKMERCFDT